jgi:outer membrane protein assembly factor BamB
MESDTGVPNDLKVWCGMGWTGQPNVIERPDGVVELRFGGYDGRYHFVDAETGERIRDDVVTGDLTKGSATTDPFEPDLYYGGSRDNFLRVMALDRQEPEVLWALDAETSVPDPRWNDDWDGAPLVVGDYLLEGGENSWFYVIRLNRDHDGQGRVTVSPEIVLTVPSWDDELLSELDDEEPRLSIESSVAYFDGVAYFSNSAGLVQGWDISGILGGGGPESAEQVFRFWTGDDTDGTITIDDRGFLYVASELERFNTTGLNNGQLMKLDPRNSDDPIVWSVAVTEEGQDGNGGLFSTPALAGPYLYATTNAGSLIAVRRDDGQIAWRIELPDPTWSSPVVVDDVLVVGDCAGVLHGYDVSSPGRYPTELWKVQLDGCIEATPAVWKGRIYLGTREGPIYALGDS